MSNPWRPWDAPVYGIGRARTYAFVPQDDPADTVHGRMPRHPAVEEFQHERFMTYLKVSRAAENERLKQMSIAKFDAWYVEEAKQGRNTTLEL